MKPDLSRPSMAERLPPARSLAGDAPVAACAFNRDGTVVAFAMGDGRVRLLPGMLVRLSIVTERHAEALVAPKRALEREGDRRFLLVAEPESEGASRAVVQRVEVREGFTQGDLVEVLPVEAGTLAPGDAVIVVGGDDVDPGDVVEVDAGT